MEKKTQHEELDAEADDGWIDVAMRREFKEKWTDTTNYFR